MNLSQEGELMKVGLDWQVALKLAVSAFSGLLAVWGVLTTAGVRRVLQSIPACLLIAILLLAFPSALSGYSASALPATLINLSYVAFIATCLVFLKEKTLFHAIVWGTLLACAFAWFLYIFVPSYGVFQEFLGSVTVQRLGGHSHPNSVGRTAAIGFLCVAALWRERGLSTPVAFALLILFAMTIVFTLSRTVMAGTAIAVGVLYLDWLKTKAGIQWLLVGAFVGLLGIFFLIASGNEGDTLSKFAGSVSKTGDTSELTSGTGRVDIWAEAIRVIGQQPITGYGFGAAQELLVDYSQATHSMFLHAAMISGVFGGGLMICLAIWLLHVGFNGQFRPISALAIFIFISGLVEDTVMETFPGPATLVFYVACLCPMIRRGFDRHSTVAQNTVNQDGDHDGHRQHSDWESEERNFAAEQEEPQDFEPPRLPR